MVVPNSFFFLSFFISFLSIQSLFDVNICILTSPESITKRAKNAVSEYKNIKQYLFLFLVSLYFFSYPTRAQHIKLILNSRTLKRNRLTNITADAISNLSSLRILWVSAAYLKGMIWANILSFQIEYNANFPFLFYFFSHSLLLCLLKLLREWWCAE